MEVEQVRTCDAQSQLVPEAGSNGDVTVSDSAKLKQDSWMAEYQTLRQEILNHQTMASQIITLGVTVGGIVALGVATDQKDGQPLSTSMAIIRAVLLYTAAIIYYALISIQVCRKEKIYRIGRYIECVIEPRMPGMFWESAWDRRDPESADASAFAETFPLFGLQIASLLGFGWYASVAIRHQQAAFQHWRGLEMVIVGLMLLVIFWLIGRVVLQVRRVRANIYAYRNGFNITDEHIKTRKRLCQECHAKEGDNQRECRIPEEPASVRVWWRVCRSKTPSQ